VKISLLPTLLNEAVRNLPHEAIVRYYLNGLRQILFFFNSIFDLPASCSQATKKLHFVAYICTWCSHL